MSSPSKNSSKGAPEGSQPPPPKDRQSILSRLLFSGRKEKPGEPQSSKVNENPEGPKTSKAPSKGPDGKTVFKPKDDLTICWKEESQFWSIPEGDGPVELLKVCWLDVSGEMRVTKGKAYEVSFMLSMNTENSDGWDDPVTVMARIGKKGKYQRKEINLKDLSEKVEERPQDKCRVEFESKSDEKSESKEEPPAKKSDQTNKKGDENAKNDEETLYFGLYEVWTNKWKAGLRIHEAIVQERGINDPPPNNRSRRKEIAAGINDPPPNNRSRGKEIAAHDD
ncbi:hypothetical protein NC652_035404 [Populus alba x Populus x berolinensis]|uniref:Protein PHLOEM PROTEIN 2-LIKE A9-like n=1 Tax=Populus tomentosa TaxID=118781 RepID=A0A8X7YEG6_POPTO|nr:hypothetical protein POTOM_049749 [Populus tomentosa]KAJ6876028.1 hypothetical protein NC652_035404 [Populus alba x Populus x berolinensis]